MDQIASKLYPGEAWGGGVTVTLLGQGNSIGPAWTRD